MGVFSCVTCWCVHGAAHIWTRAVAVVNFCLVLVRLVAVLSTAVPKMVASCCKAFSCHPWKVLFYFLIFWILRIRVVAICVASSIGI